MSFQDDQQVLYKNANHIDIEYYRKNIVSAWKSHLFIAEINNGPTVVAVPDPDAEQARCLKAQAMLIGVFTFSFTTAAAVLATSDLSVFTFGPNLETLMRYGAAFYREKWRRIDAIAIRVNHEWRLPSSAPEGTLAWVDSVLRRYEKGTWVETTLTNELRVIRKV